MVSRCSGLRSSRCTFMENGKEILRILKKKRLLSITSHCCNVLCSCTEQNEGRSMSLMKHTSLILIFVAAIIAITAVLTISRSSLRGEHTMPAPSATFPTTTPTTTAPTTATTPIVGGTVPDGTIYAKGHDAGCTGTMNASQLTCSKTSGSTCNECVRNATNSRCLCK